MSLLRKLGKWVPFGRVPEVRAEALQAELESDAPPLLIDVRTQTEWEQSRIPGALSIPLSQLPDRLATLDTTTRRRVVAICLSAHRSIPAVRLLREHGFEDASQLGGGMLAWWAHKLPTEKGAG